MRAPLRRLWLKVHRWVGLTLGPILGLAALLGAALVIALPLDRQAHPEFFVARTEGDPRAALLPLESVRQRVRAEFGAGASLTLRPPRQPGDTLWARVGGPWSGTLYIDPFTGAEQGRRGTHEGAYNMLFELHSSLLLADTGKAILAWAALAYLFLLATGLVLWWPARWPPSLRIVLDRGLVRGLFDLHRTGGAVLGFLVAVSVFSGAYMAWRPLGEAISSLLGQPRMAPPQVAAIASDVPRRDLDAIIARAQQVFPGQPIGFIHVGARPDTAVRVRFRLPDDPHPNGIGSVWLHPLTGEVLAVRRWQQLDSGTGAVAVIYPLHTGALGGVLHEVLVALLGLMLAGLGLSGVWLWWRRRVTRQRVTT